MGRGDEEMISRNNQEKIRGILDARHEHRCPYCLKELHVFLHDDKKAYGCDNHPQSLRVEDGDYLIAIENVLKWGNNHSVDNVYRKLDSF